MSQKKQPADASPPTDQPPKPSDDRRNFITKAVAAVFGGVLVVFPFLAGLAVFFDPLRRKSSSGGTADPFIRVTTLDALPADGVPRRFPVVADRRDAWTQYRNVPIGSVYLRRTPDGQIEALNTICPHLGCFVNFDEQADCFKCPCHNSFFKLDGAIIEPSPSPRAMDTLEFEERPDDGTTEIWVKYENFYTGIEDKKAKM